MQHIRCSPRCLLALALAITHGLPGADAGASCCMTKAAGLKVPDPYATQPADWDEEDDGPWQPDDVDLTSVRGWWRWKYEFKDLVRSNAGWLLAGLVEESSWATVGTQEIHYHDQ